MTRTNKTMIAPGVDDHLYDGGDEFCAQQEVFDRERAEHDNQ